MKMHFPDPVDLLNFILTITPDEGMPLFPVLRMMLIDLCSLPPRYVQGRRICLLLCNQLQLPS